MEVKGLIYALLGYVVSLALIVLFWYWWFDKPLEWRIFISIASSLISIGVAYGILSEYSNDKMISFIVMAIIAAFWILFVVVDILGFFQNAIDTINNKPINADAMDIVMYIIDEIISSKIFAVISGIAAYFEYQECRDLLKKNNV